MRVKHLLLALLASLPFTTPALSQIERVWLTHQSQDASRIVVSWQSAEPGNSIVEYGATPRLGEVATVAGRRTLHHVEIPLTKGDAACHYRVKTGSQVSDIASFKGYPDQTLRIAVVANIRADARLDFTALKKENVHLLLSSGDTAMQFQFGKVNAPASIASHARLIDTQAELFRSTPFMPTLGNLDRKIRPKSNGPEAPAYDVEATAYRRFFALPGKEWHWSFDIPDFDLRLLSVDMSHTGDFGTPDQACHPFDENSEQLRWHERTMSGTEAGFVITLFGETGSRVRRHANGRWSRSIAKGTLAISGECYHAERTEADGITYYNTSVRGNGSFGVDPNPAFLDKSASYLLLTLDKPSGTLTAALKTLDGRELDRRTFSKRSRN